VRCVYSIVRFVPDAARGECVNVGCIVGSEESAEWAVKQVANLARARKIDDDGVSEVVGAFFEQIGRQIERYDIAEEVAAPISRELSEEWLLRLHCDYQNLVQVSEPAPMSASSVEEALEHIFALMVVDPLQRRFEFAKKSRALSRLREAYAGVGIRKGVNLREKVTLRTPHLHEAAFDFAVTNGRVVQLAQAWSFQIPSQEELAAGIRSWGWTVHDLRQEGGEGLLAGGQRMEIRPDVEIAAVFVPPADGQDSAALNEARHIFSELSVQQLPYERVRDVAQQARLLLHPA